MIRLSHLLASIVASLVLLTFGCSKSSTKHDCEPGTASCSCLADNKCNADLACVEGKCAAPSAVGFSVSDATARACQVLFTESGQRVVAVKIAKGARGKMVREAPLVGASFVSETNAPLPPGVLNLQVAGAGGAPAVSKIECFDGTGKALVGVTLTQS